MKKLIFILAILGVLLSACSATPAEETPPPITAEDIQATAISMAWTMSAQTQAAIPTATNTPVPPTETPTETAVPPTPTLAITNTPLPTATSEKDPCDKPLGEWTGTATKILVQNETKTAVNVSLYLYDNYAGYCGYVVGLIAGNQSQMFALPAGYYYAWAFTAQGEQPAFSHGLDLTGVLNADKHTLHIMQDRLKFVGP